MSKAAFNVIVEPLRCEIKTIGEYLSKDLRIGPRSALKEAFHDGLIRLNGRKSTRLDEINSGDRIEIYTTSVYFVDQMRVIPNPTLPAQKILLENEDLILIEKKAGEFTNPQRPDETNTLINRLCFDYPETSTPLRKGLPLEGTLVHRLDAGTSGILVAARNESTFLRLRDKWSSREVEKVYLTWVMGRIDYHAEIRCFMAHDEKSKKRMKVYAEAPSDLNHWAARTSFYPVLTSDDQSLLLVRIFSGVTHQIRATMHALGAPVLGDPIYTLKKQDEQKGFSQKMVSQLESKIKKWIDPSLVKEAPLDETTKTLFKKLAASLPEFTEPNLTELPPRSFFLHALWLKVNGEKKLENGVLCPPPYYFG